MVAAWAERSATLRATAATRLDWRYGQGSRCTIDLFSAGPDAPLAVFFHGGYWQMRSKEDFSFLAAGALSQGISFALAGYTLAPEADIDHIVAECGAAFELLQREVSKPLCVAGWSAGAHLAAMLLDRPGVAGGLAISGIYDLEPIAHSYVNDKLQLNAASALRNSPIRQLPDASPPLTLAYGAAELPELRRHSQDYASVREARALPTQLICVDQANHFSILEALAAGDGVLAGVLSHLVRG